MTAVTPQSLVASHLMHEAAERSADEKLLVELRRHHLAMAAAYAERLKIQVCEICGKKK